MIGLLKNHWVSLYTLLLFFLLGADVNAQPKSKLRVYVYNLQSHKGALLAALYADEKSFLVPTQYFAHRSIESNACDTMSFYFENIPVGKYALAIFLDKNHNKKLDTNFFGIPKEPFGFSSNKLPRFRAPTFEETAFDIKGEYHEVRVKLVIL